MNATSERKETFSVVVENPNSWNSTTGEHEITAHCGHNHKTLEAAEKCISKLTRSYCNHGHASGTPCHQCCGYAQSHSTSARWYHAQIKTNWTDAQLAKFSAEEEARRKVDEEYYERENQKAIAEERAFLDSFEE